MWPGRDQRLVALDIDVDVGLARRATPPRAGRCRVGWSGRASSPRECRGRGKSPRPRRRRWPPGDRPGGGERRARVVDVDDQRDAPRFRGGPCAAAGSRPAARGSRREPSRALVLSGTYVKAAHRPHRSTRLPVLHWTSMSQLEHHPGAQSSIASALLGFPVPDRVQPGAAHPVLGARDRRRGLRLRRRRSLRAGAGPAGPGADRRRRRSGRRRGAQGRDRCPHDGGVRAHLPGRGARGGALAVPAADLLLHRGLQEAPRRSDGALQFRMDADIALVLQVRILNAYSLILERVYGFDLGIEFPWVADHQGSRHRSRPAPRAHHEPPLSRRGGDGRDADPHRVPICGGCAPMPPIPPS